MFYQLYHHIKNKYFEELQGMPAAIREAVIFQKTLEEIPITIKSEDLIAGWYGYKDEKECVSVFGAETNRDFVFEDTYSVEDRLVLRNLQKDFCIRLGFEGGHTCIDYRFVVNHGLKGYAEKVQKELEKSVEAENSEKKIYLKAMLISLNAVCAYANRYACLAAEKLQTAVDGERERLEKIQKTMSRVPWLPARDFHEALSAVWIMHTVIPISDNSWASISLGRMDQYMYPFFKKEMAHRHNEIKAALKNLFLLLNSYGDGACALNIGGMSRDGQDEINELSIMLIEVEKEMRMASPIFVVRVAPGMPEKVLDEVIDRDLFSIGQPTFYGELSCRRAMIERGVPEKDASDFSVNSCMGLFLSGEEVASMWGCVFNMHLPLELAINEGKPLFSNLPFELEADLELMVDKEKTPDTLEDLWTAYEKYQRFLLKKLFALNRKSEINFAKNRPNPLLSVMTAGCVEKGQDRAIGAKYVTETVETMGFANTANAIAAIDTLVFQKRKYTLNQIKEAVRQDFAGEDKILADIRKCEKYGTNNKYVDEICKRLCEITAKVCKELSFDNVYYIPSMHTLDTNIDFGEKLYTTLDGRMKGEPVNKNAGPTNEVRSADPTSLVISAASLPQEFFSGGQPIDLYFAPDILDTREGREKIKALIKTYFQLGGLQVQVNSIDVKLLEMAYDNPKDFPFLIVRIGGYSCKFCELPRNVQREFIDRFRSESA